MLDIRIAGLAPDFVPYLDGWELQRSIHREVVAGDRPDTLLLLEHEAVYTAGKRTEPQERPQDGTPVVDVDRGGKITWHGPGQLVGYPIVRLAEPLDVVAYVRRLEQLIIETITEFGIVGERVEGRSGVWVRDLSDPDRSAAPDMKIGAIGIRVSDGVTMHGFALNCSNAFEAYDAIVACGLPDARVTSITREIGREVTPSDVVPVIRARFERVIGPSLASRQESRVRDARSRGPASGIRHSEAAGLPA